MVKTLILLFIGFILLKKGADLLVEGASSLAKKFKISEAVIGLTVVALGTTMPEFVVGITASLGGQSDVVLGNVIGSVIVNFLFILGAASMVCPLLIRKGTVSQELPFFFFSVLAVFLLANDGFLNGGAKSVITGMDGLVLLLFFVFFIYYAFSSGRFSKQELEDVKVEKVEKVRFYTSVAMVVGGAAALFLGGKWVVDGAVEVAKVLGISEALIGLTLVAFGTSLPELITAITAARKGKAEIAVGNIIGANILNLVWILGACSFIREINYSEALNIDLIFSALAAVFLSIVIFSGRKNVLSRWEGAALFSFYVLYLVFIFNRG